MKQKNIGCALVFWPWLALLAYAIIQGEPADPGLAALIGNVLWIWPTLGVIASWIGAGRHWITGAGDYDPTPNHDFMRYRQGESGKMFAGLTLTLIGTALAYMFAGPVGSGDLGALLIVCPLMFGGLAVFVVFYFLSLSVDDWSYSEQRRIAGLNDAYIARHGGLPNPDPDALRQVFDWDNFNTGDK